MTPDERGLLDDIIENPADDGVRLIYADWMEEHDRADRADLIRVQIEMHGSRCVLARPDDDAYGAYCNRRDCRHRVLNRLAADILRGGAANPPVRASPEWTWLGDPLRAICTAWAGGVGWDWRRGFIHAVGCPLAAWLEHGPGLCSLQPVERLEVTDASPLPSDSLPGGSARYAWTKPYPGGARPWKVPSDWWCPELDPWFDSEDAALAALNGAALRWGRRIALLRGRRRR